MVAGNPRDDVVRLTQALVVEANQVRTAFVAAHGLHATDIEALTQVVLARQLGASVTAGALASQLGLTTGAITAVVDRLERTGQLTRVRDPHDRRKVLMESTAQGEELAARYLDPVRARTDTVLDQFDAVELAVIRQFLTTTAEAMAAHHHELRRSGGSRPPS